MIGLPPSDAGALKLTLACALPPVAVPIVGAPGAVAGAVGVTLFDAADAGLVPTAFVAVTLNVYAVPLVNPVTVIGLDAAEAVKLPGVDVTV